jgi:hypothetical protein
VVASERWSVYRGLDHVGTTVALSVEWRDDHQQARLVRDKLEHTTTLLICEETGAAARTLCTITGRPRC